MFSSDTTGRTDKRTLFVLAGGSEVVEELAAAARHKEKRRTPSSSEKCWPTTTPHPMALSALAHPCAAEEPTKGRSLSLRAVLPPQLDIMKSGERPFSLDNRWRDLTSVLNTRGKVPKRSRGWRSQLDIRKAEEPAFSARHQKTPPS
ncbi:hypothetical protein D1B33_17420 [Lysinibacillus yapensis]|uniref:Uncharacterized protein n=1 Tax=Ureibacillus yapensis TaxID=2304605 RepID=A0A396SHZ0_9BACL|nr:hypothetical protein [Lysinibacillus yapensis]RHW31741.1 hypothetical protein D1B33_17420 [Lysinibacillus yapensis]